MELGQHLPQILVGLVVVFSAAFALICDFLRAKNEQLRELTIELKVRREEEQRHSQTMTAHTVPANAPTPRERMGAGRIESPAARALTTASPGKERKRAPSGDALAAMERGAQLAASPRKRSAAPHNECEAAPSEIQTAYTQSTRTEENTSGIAQMPSVQPAPAVAIPKPIALAARHSLAKDGVARHGVSQDANGGSKKDWGSLRACEPAKSMQEVTSIQHEARPVVEVHEDLLDAMLAAAASANAQSAAGATVPAGFHDGYILSRLVQSRQPVSGLVVSIGVNTPRNSDGSMPEPIRKLVESLIGPGDFACQSSSEEFLLIYPNERGASAQRRLSKIAQQLWDFQLRSLGSFSILFSWGGVEVRSESLDDAIASANERMHETRRGRKLLTMEPRGGQQLRQAV